ncbi:MAG: hypothetical protein H6617_07420 [Bdellovibrionaceae bacterium]|nr:hypothetical protein [Bdellovibrionales bacterium]MCB9254496.1 hypothetical protein [Pseudobdellovibrionaceae bacterium]
MRFLSVVMLFLAIGVNARAERGLDALRGEYPILEYDGDTLASGYVQIISDENVIGVYVSGLALASRPALNLSVLTPSANTDVSEDSDRVTQRYSDGRGSSRIEYTRHTGYLEIQTEVCVEGDGCERNTIFAGQTGSPGTEIDYDTFFLATAGMYKIQSAGGAPPKPENEGAIVDGNFGYLMLPYCEPGGACNPGYIFVDRASTRFFRREGTAGTQLDMVLSQNGAVRYYSWTERGDGEVLFRDFQYRLNEARVCMEHVLIR